MKPVSCKQCLYLKSTLSAIFAMLFLLADQTYNDTEWLIKATLPSSALSAQPSFFNALHYNAIRKDIRNKVHDRKTSHSYNFSTKIISLHQNRNQQQAVSTQTQHSFFSSGESNLQHLKELKHGKKFQHRCHKCQTSFKSKALLFLHHYRVECSSGPFKCDECTAGFLWKSSLTRHKKIHKQFPCEHCSLSFTNASSLQTHKKAHEHASNITRQVGAQSSSVPARAFHCEKCPASFPKWQALIKHEISHLGIKMFSCQKCSNSFNQKSELELHQWTQHL